MSVAPPFRGQEIPDVGPSSHSQPFRNPFQDHRRFLSQPAGNRHLGRIAFVAKQLAFSSFPGGQGCSRARLRVFRSGFLFSGFRFRLFDSKPWNGGQGHAGFIHGGGVPAFADARLEPSRGLPFQGGNRVGPSYQGVALR